MEHGDKIWNRVIDWGFFVLLLGAVSAVTLTLFYRQCMGNPEYYPSDMEAYILEMQGLESGYDFPYPVLFKVSALLHLAAGPELSVALAGMFFNSLAILVTKLAFNRLALPGLQKALARRGQKGRSADMSWLGGIFLTLGAVSLFFISMLYPPPGIYLPGIRFKYTGVFTANPYHNATYLAARPFGILAFLWFVRLLPVYEKGPAKSAGEREGAAVSDYVLFAVFLLLATMTKPSFTLVMVSTAGLVMLWRLIRSGFGNFVPTVQLGLCFLPTFADLLYQYRGVFVAEPGQEGGVGFCFGDVWGLYCDNIPLALCLAVGFPLLVLVCNWKELRRNTFFRFSWLFYLLAFAEAFLLYEKGFRETHFNFSWGYMYGIFFCHLGALLLLLQAPGQGAGEKSRTGEKREKGAGRDRKSLWRKGLYVLQWGAYLCHVVCGLFYFGLLLSGEGYY